jgi:pimeloyl-ACP methyl ester carboxylesterase
LATLPTPAGGAAHDLVRLQNNTKVSEPETTSLRTRDDVALIALHYPGHRARRPDGELGVVLAHGFTGSSHDPHVRAISAHLQQHGIGVLAPDLRGHGRSGGVSTVGDKEILDVAAAVAWMRAAGYRRVAVLGWSMGGSVVLRYAGLGGDCDAVVSVSSPGYWFERATPAMRVVHWVCETRTGRAAVRVARHTRIDPNGWPAEPRSPLDVVGAIAPGRLLIVHGDADHYFPLRHAQLLAAEAPAAQLWVEPGMGHAESATSPELMDRIVTWLDAAVCDDGRRG